MRTIRAQIILFAVSLVLLVGGGISAYSIDQNRRSILEATQLEAKKITSTLASLIIDDLYFLNLSNIRLLLQSAKASSDVTMIYIADSSKLILTDGTRLNPNANLPLTSFVEEQLLDSKEISSSIGYEEITVAGPIRTADESLIGYICVKFSLREARKILYKTTVACLLITGVSLLVGTLISIWFAARFSQPILKVVQFAGTIGSGNFSKRVHINRRDEIQDLADSVNRMAKNLEDHTRKLEVARVEAEEASKAKSEFLATMSHEIRTPLNGITSLAKLLLYTELDGQQKEDVETIQYSVESLRQIISDILDFSKIEAGQLELYRQEFELAKVVRRICRPFQSICETKEIEFLLNLDPRLPIRVTGDSLRLEQVLRNLLSNAIKFTEAHGAIVVNIFVEEFCESQADIHFAVSDTGIGIPEEKTHLIFESFKQADSTTTRKYGGTGLGLSISQRLIEMMGGTIWLKSKEGIGSRFHFVIPVAVETEGDKQPEGEEELEQKNFLDEEEEKLFKSRRVLLVEDNEINQSATKRVLEKNGCRVIIAHNGGEAIATLNKDRFDIVLMDLHMPGINGLETTRKIRKSEEPYAEVPIVALTAHGVQGVVEECLATGMNGFVSKPVDYDRLLKLIEAVCEDTRGLLLREPERPIS